MESIIACVVGLVAGGFVGYNFGVRKALAKMKDLTQEFIDVVRAQYGTTVKREVNGEDAEFVELVPEIEELADTIFEQ